MLRVVACSRAHSTKNTQGHRLPPPPPPPIRQPFIRYTLRFSLFLFFATATAAAATAPSTRLLVVPYWCVAICSKLGSRQNSVLLFLDAHRLHPWRMNRSSSRNVDALALSCPFLFLSIFYNIDRFLPLFVVVLKLPVTRPSSSSSKLHVNFRSHFAKSTNWATSKLTTSLSQRFTRSEKKDLITKLSPDVSIRHGLAACYVQKSKQVSISWDFSRTYFLYTKSQITNRAFTFIFTI